MESPLEGRDNKWIHAQRGSAAGASAPRGMIQDAHPIISTSSRSTESVMHLLLLLQQMWFCIAGVACLEWKLPSCRMAYFSTSG
ncbi:hypothetical protein JIN82_00345 [Persicirhabdus sediminis]|uniref:Uncharacterized protein n=1 Tax=Persicirhabdus sediminis TaxID=454144 RepID=A0A8J7M9W0_9BACT|nr:hypothetical protein [Persicirhabdus sediminis]